MYFKKKFYCKQIKNINNLIIEIVLTCPPPNLNQCKKYHFVLYSLIYKIRTYFPLLNVYHVALQFENMC